MPSPVHLMGRFSALRDRSRPAPAPHPYRYTYDASGVLHRTHIQTGVLEHESYGEWRPGPYVSLARRRTAASPARSQQVETA